MQISTVVSSLRFGFLFGALALAIFSSCDTGPELQNSIEINTETEVQRASFRMGNGEIRTEMLSEFEKYDVQYWLNEDGSIGYLTADAATIDRIYYDVRGRYIARN